MPWDDDIGERLRGWLGIDKATFLDGTRVAHLPMRFCYPGRRAGGDAPARRECAPQWHDAMFGILPPERLTLLLGMHAQARYLPAAKRWPMAENVRAWGHFGDRIALPHPAWRSRLFMARHPWFEADILPALRARVRAALDQVIR